MSGGPHLFLALSGHGFGHLAQAAPILAGLAGRLPGLRLTIQTTLPRAVLEARLPLEFRLIPHEADFGMRMHSALRVDLPASLADYRRFHGDWDERLARQRRILSDSAPDLLLANVPYLPLAAADSLDIPSVAFCSLNWADILEGCSPDARVTALAATIRQHYRRAACFLRLTPGMPMEGLPNRRVIGPVAQVGTAQARQLRERLGLGPAQRLLLVAMGGVGVDLRPADWGLPAHVHCLLPGPDPDPAAGLHTWAETGLSVTDLIASVDAVLCKPGYGTFVEAACCATPLVYLERGDWPEEGCLTDWLQSHARSRRLTRTELRDGGLWGALRDLWSAPAGPAVQPTGVAEAVAAILTRLPTRTP